jgi:indolepyruvate ferredoxin oxidoreductase alpha subunit
MVGRIKILRIGFSHPMPANLIKDFLKECKKVLIVEEGEPYMEGLILPINGKRKDLFSRLYEFNPGLVRQCLARYFDVPYTLPKTADLSDIPEIPQRPPNLCAGCSHRATYYAVKKAAEDLETIYPTDIGCYTPIPLACCPLFPWPIFSSAWDHLSELLAAFQRHYRHDRTSAASRR